MFTRFQDRLAVLAAGVALLIAGYAAVVVNDARIPNVLVLAGLGLGWVLTIFGVVDLARRVIAGAREWVGHWRARPDLRFGVRHSDNLTVNQTSRVADFVLVRVTNDAPLGEAEARNVFGRLTFQGPSGAVLRIAARPASTGFRADGNEERVNIPAGGGHQDFDVAARFHGEGDAFAINTEAFVHHAAARNESWRLSGQVHDVEIEIIHSRGATRHKFTLNNPTSGPLEIVDSSTGESAEAAQSAPIPPPTQPDWAAPSPFSGSPPDPPSQADLKVKIPAEFVQYTAVRSDRARIWAWWSLRRLLRREPSHAQLEAEVRRLLDQPTDDWEITDDQIREFIAAGGRPSEDVLPWNRPR